MSQRFDYLVKYAFFYPLLKPAVASLVWRIVFWQVPPAGTRFYNPQNAFQYFAFVPPGPALAITSNRAIGNKILNLFPLLLTQLHESKITKTIYETSSSLFFERFVCWLKIIALLNSIKC